MSNSRIIKLKIIAEECDTICRGFGRGGSYPASEWLCTLKEYYILKKHLN